MFLLHKTEHNLVQFSDRAHHLVDVSTKLPAFINHDAVDNEKSDFSLAQKSKVGYKKDACIKFGHVFLIFHDKDHKNMIKWNRNSLY